MDASDSAEWQYHTAKETCPFGGRVVNTQKSEPPSTFTQTNLSVCARKIKRSDHKGTSSVQKPHMYQTKLSKQRMQCPQCEASEIHSHLNLNSRLSSVLCHASASSQTSWTVAHPPVLEKDPVDQQPALLHFFQRFLPNCSVNLRIP